MNGKRLGGRLSYLFTDCLKSELACLGREDFISLIKLTLSARGEKNYTIALQRFPWLLQSEIRFEHTKIFRTGGSVSGDNMDKRSNTQCFFFNRKQETVQQTSGFRDKAGREP